jgi:hypothetical protein
MNKKLEAVRTAVADYMHSKGCSCCRDTEAHEEHEAKLAQLLEVPPYEDGSGYNFAQFRTEKRAMAERPLGNTQLSVLRALAQHNGGVWYAGCGWLWDNYSGTMRIMEALTKRGLATRTEQGRQVRFTITEAGRAAL